MRLSKNSTKQVVSEVGVALRKCPNNYFVDSVLCYLPYGSSVTLLKDVVYDEFGDTAYEKVRLESGKEGYVNREALGDVK